MPPAGSACPKYAPPPLPPANLLSSGQNYAFFSPRKRGTFPAARSRSPPAYQSLSDYIRNENIRICDHILKAVPHTACQNDARRDYRIRTDTHSPVPNHGRNGCIYSKGHCPYIPHRLPPSSYDAADKNWRYRYPRWFLSA